MLDYFVTLFTTVTPTEVYILMLLLLLACGLGLPLPEDITLISAGYIAYKGIIDPGAATFIGLVGVLAGDSFIYYMGRRFGIHVFTFPFLKNVFTAERLEKGRELLRNHGNKFLFVNRFLAGLRAPIIFACASLGIKYRNLLFYDGIAALISVPLLIYSAYYGGEYIDNVIEIAKRVENFILASVIILVSFYLIRRYLKKRKNAFNCGE